MKKMTAAAFAMCMLLAGCGVGYSASGENMNAEASIGIFHYNTSYFDRYAVKKNENSCKVQGTLHQAADDQDGSIITYVTGLDETGSMAVTGSMDCTRGNIQLVYTAPDGTQTVIADGADKKIDAMVDVAEGEGSVGFAGDGKSAVCEFHIKMTAADGVTFADIMEEDGGENAKEIEDKPLKPVKPESESSIGTIGAIEEIEDIGTSER